MLSDSGDLGYYGPNQEHSDVGAVGGYELKLGDPLGVFKILLLPGGHL